MRFNNFFRTAAALCLAATPLTGGCHTPPKADPEDQLAALEFSREELPEIRIEEMLEGVALKEVPLHKVPEDMPFGPVKSELDGMVAYVKRYGTKEIKGDETLYKKALQDMEMVYGESPDGTCVELSLTGDMQIASVKGRGHIKLRDKDADGTVELGGNEVCMSGPVKLRKGENATEKRAEITMNAMMLTHYLAVHRNEVYKELLKQFKQYMQEEPGR
ncbi:MAG: hypothetical protein ACE5FW_03205, partial [Candidatus Aenigmatarchaeota archaeon]